MCTVADKLFFSFIIQYILLKLLKVSIQACCSSSIVLLHIHCIYICMYVYVYVRTYRYLDLELHMYIYNTVYKYIFYCIFLTLISAV